MLILYNINHLYKELKQYLCNTVMERSPEYIVKTRKQGVEYCEENATFLFKEDMNKYMYLLLCLKMEG